jgi:hypothetical protein
MIRAGARPIFLATSVDGVLHDHDPQSREAFPRWAFAALAAADFVAAALAAFLATAGPGTAFFVVALFDFGALGRFLTAARWAACHAALAHSDSSSGSSKSRAGNSQYEFTVTVLVRV